MQYKTRTKWENLKLNGKHKRIEHILGKPNTCAHCNTTTAKRYEWANKDHKYSENPKEWIRLCPPCHKKLDKKTPELCKCGNKHFAKKMCKKCYSQTPKRKKYFQEYEKSEKRKKYTKIYGKSKNHLKATKKYRDKIKKLKSLPNT